ncbi:hypothetical protein L3Q82_003361 [Scortum barcoo]|uniref:Uncharacterized protein n=1 Tax=Scortum barcoo TaxID=214431 RepID=A0ACB8VM53_9TELE|nr:hypothetical protein L3Q82_003361 [Scortum barcoo]
MPQGASWFPREHCRSARSSPAPTEARAPPTPSEEPMQLGRTKLDLEERLRRLKEGACFYCRQTGHRVNALSLHSIGSQYYTAHCSSIRVFVLSLIMYKSNSENGKTVVREYSAD